MTKGGSSPACAACKYQRRKCSSDCVLAPYFPANEHQTFQKVHRLYGVSKIMNLLKEVTTNELREDAMKSIKYESEMRARFPVNGCLTIINHLYHQLQHAHHELHCVHHQLSIHKHQFLTNQFTPNHNSCVDDEFAASGYEHMNLMTMSTTPNVYSYELDNNNTNSSMLIQTPSFHLEETADASLGQGYEDIFFNPLTDDNSQSYCESRSGSSLRDINEKLAIKNDLKSAAASFSLISLK